VHFGAAIAGWRAMIAFSCPVVRTPIAASASGVVAFVGRGGGRGQREEDQGSGGEAYEHEALSASNPTGCNDPPRSRNIVA
jgi:hypothetical protein